LIIGSTRATGFFFFELEPPRTYLTMTAVTATTAIPMKTGTDCKSSVKHIYVVYIKLAVIIITAVGLMYLLTIVTAVAMCCRWI